MKTVKIALDFTSESFYTRKYPGDAAEQRRNELERKYKCPIWITQDHHVIPVMYMRDNHLRNAHASIVQMCTDDYVDWNYLRMQINVARLHILCGEMQRRGTYFDPIQYAEIMAWLKALGRAIEEEDLDTGKEVW